MDHLGSVLTVSDEMGRVDDSIADTGAWGYDAWGGDRGANGEPLSTSRPAPVGNRAFTGQEAISSLGLVNMNGRVYDPKLGRMLSPDPTLQYPENLQSYNRYSYVQNNPLSYADPTGFFLGLSATSWMNIGLGVGGIAVCSFAGPGCGALVAIASLTANATAVALSGGSANQVAETIIVGGGTGFLGGAFGSAVAGDLGGGVLAKLAGGA